MKVKRPISPVIATLLLILITISASILVYVWVTGYASSVTSAEAPQLQERIKIDTVSVTENNDEINVTIYVRNIGNVEINVTSGYIIDATTSEVVGSNTEEELKVAPGKVELFNVTITNELSPGRTYIAKVVTKNGVEATYSFTYSQS